MAWIKEEESLRISEISKRLNVSEMTVYRDIKPLVENGQVIKTAGGITLNKPKQQLGQLCVVCGKGAGSRLAVQIVKNDSQIEQFCCVHCAMLRYEKVKDDVSQIICRDFCWIRRSAPKLPSFAGYRSSFELLRAACAPFRF